MSVDASGVVPVGVRPPPPLRGSSPCEAGQFCHPHGEQKGRNDPPHGKQNGHYGRRMESRRGVTSRAEFIKSPLNFYCSLFLLRIISFNEFVSVWMFLMSRGCEPPQAFQANLPFRRSSFIFPIYLYFSSSVSVDGGLFASNIRFSRRPADSFVTFLTGTLPPSSVRILHQWSCGCWRIRWPRSGGRSLLVFPTVGGIM